MPQSPSHIHAHKIFHRSYSAMHVQATLWELEPLGVPHVLKHKNIQAKHHCIGGRSNARSARRGLQGPQWLRGTATSRTRCVGTGAFGGPRRRWLLVRHAHNPLQGPALVSHGSELLRVAWVCGASVTAGRGAVLTCVPGDPWHAPAHAAGNRSLRGVARDPWRGSRSLKGAAQDP